MRIRVQKFIENNIDLIENNDWEEFYKKAPNEFRINFIGQITETLLEAGIDPLLYLNFIPENYLSSADIQVFEIPDHIKSIGDRAFSGCCSLTNITIPNGVTSVGNSAFDTCDMLKNIDIPNTIVHIGYEAFSGCQSLVNITIPDNVTTIDNSTFSNCISLKNIVIPDAVTKIGAFAFFNCKNLTNITIGRNVKSIGDYAFSRCKKLETLYYNNTSESWIGVLGGINWELDSGITLVICTDKVIEVR